MSVTSRPSLIASTPMETARPSNTDRPFGVILGPDYAGKSTVIKNLSARFPAHFLSLDCIDFSARYPLVNRLQNSIKSDALSIGTTYSPEFITTLLHAYIVFLRDRILAADLDKPIIVDSYYYKLISKLSLRGLINETVFATWRSFPQPRNIIYLDLDADMAWHRSDQGKRLNSLEFYGRAPTRDGFDRFQAHLRRAMLREVHGIPISRIDASQSVNRIVSSVEDIILSGHINPS